MKKLLILLLFVFTICFYSLAGCGNELEIVKEDLYSQLYSLESIVSTDEELNQAITTAKTEIQVQIDALNDTYSTDKEIEDAINTAKSVLETQTNNVKSILEQKINEAKQELQVKLETLSQNITDKDSELAKIIENTKVAIQTQIDSLDYKYSEQISDIYKLINNLIEERENHTVTFKYQDAREDLVLSVKHGYKVNRPENPSRAGYVFNGWKYFDGVEYEKWVFGGYAVLEDLVLIADWDYATKELPIINIDTNGEKINSKVDYTTMTFSIENCDGELNNVTGGIRLRGNTTKSYDKKPYRIKFDKKQSLFGLEKAKSWVLLAEYLDPSALHNYTAMSIGKEMPGLAFTTSPNKVNVYLNGEFKGIYTLCEQVQENEGRMNIEMDEITEDMTDLSDFNYFISMDTSVKGDVDSVLDETYFYIEKYDRYFELKYPEKGDFVSDEQFNSFFSQLKSHVEHLLDIFAEKNVQAIKEEININSLADYLIVDQIMGELDHASKSFHMYYTNTSSLEENGKISFGPIWDYDWSLFTNFTGNPNEQYTNYTGKDCVRISSNPFYQSFYQTPEFLSFIKERYTLYGAVALEKYLEELDGIVSSIEESNELNRQLWYSDLDPEIVDKNISYLKDFLTDRKRILDRDWALDK